MSTPILCCLKFFKPFFIDKNASKFALDAILLKMETNNKL